jgi:hypothetical protein
MDMDIDHGHGCTMDKDMAYGHGICKMDMDVVMQYGIDHAAWTRCMDMDMKYGQGHAA